MVGALYQAPGVQGGYSPRGGALWPRNARAQALVARKKIIGSLELRKLTASPRGEEKLATAAMAYAWRPRERMVA
jgi:hypothetical protein